MPPCAEMKFSLSLMADKNSLSSDDLDAIITCRQAIFPPGDAFLDQLLSLKEQNISRVWIRVHREVAL